jgi:Phage gp6-like head-tail connector protein
MPAFVLVTPPTGEPITLAEAKAHLRVDHSADDTLITAYITAARQAIEHYTGRALMTQTWRLWLDAWPDQTDPWWDGIQNGPVSMLQSISVMLPRPPLLSVVSVQTYSDQDVATVWPATNYYVDTVSTPGRLNAKQNGAWPSPGRVINGIMIEYQAGYGNAAAVPEVLKLALRQWLAHLYEHRGEQDKEKSPAAMPFAVEAILQPYRLRGTTFDW